MHACNIYQDTDARQNDLCETTDGVRSYSGYVHLPAGALADLGVQNQTYEINTFFWFFESRKDPTNAPLSIWMVRVIASPHLYLLTVS
jgi:carboxypeptidase C (cathepsin A)